MVSSSDAASIRCVLISVAPRVVCVGRQVWVQLLSADQMEEHEQVAIEVVDSADQIVARYTRAFANIEGVEENHGWMIGPFWNPDRYTVRASLVGSSVMTLASLDIVSDASEIGIETLGQALNFRIQANHRLEAGEPHIAALYLRRAAVLYDQIEESQSSANAWRDLALLYDEMGVPQEAVSCAISSLLNGLLLIDPVTAYVFLRRTTSRLLSEEVAADRYDEVVGTAFLRAGPERAYIEAPEILESMSPNERSAFASTVLRLFPCVWDESSIYIYDSTSISMQEEQPPHALSCIPNDDRNSELITYESTTAVLLKALLV